MQQADVLTEERTRPIASQETAAPRRRDESVRETIERARRAQTCWERVSVKQRVRILRRARHLLAERAERLAAVASSKLGSPASALAAEVLPLLDACRFLEREAARILAPRRPGSRGRPIWLGGVDLTVVRDPFGVVLVVGPSNYPLFLVGVQTLQALVAGNAVLLKPAPGSAGAADELTAALHQAGVDPQLVAVLPESSGAVREAIATGVDKVVLTGSAGTGRRVLAQLAERLVPATMELSGCDAVFVRRDADLDLAVEALRFAVTLNHGETCIAPRRVFVHRDLAAELEGRLARSLAAQPPVEVSSEQLERLRPLLEQAIAGGAVLRSGQGNRPDSFRPVLVSGLTPRMDLARSDIFLPVVGLIEIADDAAAVEAARQCPYALGASIFGSERASRELAARVRAGVVVVNDIIVPTADPRLPFGGRGESGFGTTRGAEGLLEMTVPRAVTVRRRGGRRHLETERPADRQLFLSYVGLAHGRGFLLRLRRLGELVRALYKRNKTPNIDGRSSTSRRYEGDL